ncbi:MAG: hypothetical protein ACYTFM_11815 [Planctomycetota bacterium]|jgi:major membrane immunogen (membrane-anchored lipoprotein)
MKKAMIIVGVMLVALTGCKKTEQTTGKVEAFETAAEAKETVRVGVYDSRAIAVIYWNQEEDGKTRANRHAELGMEPQELGVLMHQQVFSYHEPVQALEYIADKLPEFMKQNNVDVLVCMWEKEELSKYNVVGSGWDDNFMENNPNVVDLIVKTNQLFDPTATQEEYDGGFGRTRPEPLDTDWKNVKE